MYFPQRTFTLIKRQRRYVSKTITDIDGGDLIRDGGGGVVVVEVAYRLGLFGMSNRVRVMP